MQEGIPTATEAWEKLTDEQKEDGEELEALMTFHSLTQAKQEQADIREQLADAIDQLEEEQTYLLEKIQKQPEGAERDKLVKNIKWHQTEINLLLEKAQSKQSSKDEISQAMKDLQKQN